MVIDGYRCSRLIVVITLQYIQISNHYVVYLKLMLYVDYASIAKKKVSDNSQSKYLQIMCTMVVMYGIVFSPKDMLRS